MKRATRLFAGLGVGLVLFLVPSVASATTWTQRSPSGTPPDPGYSQTSTAYDTANDRLTFFSIDNGAGLPRPTDTWVLAGATGSTPSWIKLAASGGPPLGRYAHSVVYAPTNNRIIIFGGCPANCGLALDDVWVLTNANGLGGTPTWSQLSPSGSGLNSEGHSALYDDLNNRLIVFGGQQGFNAPYNAVRVLANADGTGGTSAWTTLLPIGTPPAPRESVGAGYDAANNRMIIFGGATLACCATVVATYNDVWVLTHANGLGGTPEWIQLSPSGTPPAKRYWHSAVYDDTTNRLIVFGGVDTVGTTSVAYHNDVWVLSHANGLGGTPEWTQLAPTGTPPAARFGQITAYNSATKTMVMAMGRTDDPTFTLFNDVWALQEDATPPTITITTPADGASYILDSTVLADYSCQDEAGGSGLASCDGTVPNGTAIDTATVGSKTFTVDAADNAGNTASLSHVYYVTYNFAGFFAPVDNPPTFNRVKAGSGIPVKFSLGGNQGLNIFAAGYPKSEKIACDASASLDDIEQTSTAGGSSLSYDATADRYTYNWKTDKLWASTCRKLTVRLSDGTDHIAYFNFTK